MTVLTQILSSTALESASYDTESQNLTIVFDGGGEYVYEDVPQDVYEGLIRAPSPGKFFHAMIKDVF